MGKKRINQTVTLEDIAILANCSKNTVSLALRNSERISEATRNKIERLSKELGYIPHLAARQLASNRSGFIGLYIGSLHDAVRIELIKDLLAQLHSSSYMPMLGLGERKGSSWMESPWMKTYQALKVDAIIVVENVIDTLPSWSEEIPIVAVGINPHRDLHCDCISLSRVEAAELGIDYLVEKGHRRIAIASGTGNAFTDACIETTQKHRCESVLFNLDSLSVTECISRLVADLSKEKPMPDSIVFGDAANAVQFITAAGRWGIEIPKDLSVISYDYLPMAEHLRIPLTTIEQPIEKMALESVKMITDRLESPTDPFKHIQLNHVLIPRESG